MTTTVEEILEDVSFALVEPVVATTLTTAAGPGVSTPTVGSTKGLYVGAKVIVGSGGVQEIVTVTAVGASSFTASFLFAHAIGEAVTGATFPSGQTDHPLFTQDEMIGYVADVQNEYLLKVQPVFNTVDVAIVSNQRFYAETPVSIQVERISIASKPLINTAASDLAILNPDWPSENAPLPTSFFEDDQTIQQFGVYPLPQVNETATLWYSERAASSLGLLDTLLVPDIMSHYVRYGVLGRAFTKDGEQRDPDRAMYCQRRFEFGVMLGTVFMNGVRARVAAEASAVPTFRRLAVGQ